MWTIANAIPLNRTGYTEYSRLRGARLCPAASYPLQSIMLIFLILIVSLFGFVTAFAGAVHTKLPRKIRNMSFFYFGYSLTGQIFALPMLITSALIVVGAATYAAPWIALINAGTAVLCAAILWLAWRGHKRFAKEFPTLKHGAVERFILGALFPIRLPNSSVHRIKDVAYGEAGTRNQLDIYTPKTQPAAPMPVLIHIHGGAWVVGRKRQQAQPLIQHMAAKGWLVIDINYRLGPKHRMPTIFEDVLRAVAWAKTNIADYGGDPHFIALTGGSAGGHLTALASLMPNNARYKTGFEDVDCTVQASIPVYGVYDFLNRHGATKSGHDELEALLSKVALPGTPSTEHAIWEAFSPISHVSETAPPMLILHGRHDALADFESAAIFAKTLKAASHNPVIFIDLPGGQHAYDIAYAPPAPSHIRAAERFLNTTWDSWKNSN